MLLDKKICVLDVLKQDKILARKQQIDIPGSREDHKRRILIITSVERNGSRKHDFSRVRSEMAKTMLLQYFLTKRCASHVRCPKNRLFVV
jgi:hypothetical protein